MLNVYDPCASREITMMCIAICCCAACVGAIESDRSAQLSGLVCLMLTSRSGRRVTTAQGAMTIPSRSLPEKP